MNRYQIIGILNLILGLPLFILSIIFSVIVIPRLNQLYLEFNVGRYGDNIISYIMASVLFIVSIASIYLGIKNFSVSLKQEIYFKYGLITIISIILFGGILTGLMTLSVVFPLYNLTSSINRTSPNIYTLTLQEKEQNLCEKDSDCSYVWFVGNCNTPEYMSTVIEENKKKGIRQGEAPPREGVTCTCENQNCVTHN